MKQTIFTVDELLKLVELLKMLGKSDTQIFDIISFILSQPYKN